jgi:FtsH-binding integral membrane protein
LFAIMGILAYSTGLDLTRYRSLFLMGLVGLVLGSLVNVFFANGILYWILTFAGIALFLGLTAYDTQRIRRQADAAISGGQQAALQKLGVMGALSLYLDFINLFLLILRVVGRRR